MAAPWNVLVADDEDDVHHVTRLALKRKSWRGRPIALTAATSAAEARRILEAPAAPRFHCALVDVVMETNDAGLTLCDFIRQHVPRTTRIILRTGQPGVAPPERVMNDYDIDYYLAKTDVTEDRLFAILRACFRSSQDIGALLAVGAQLRAFTMALQDAKTNSDTLAAIMVESLKFVEEKYGATIVVGHELRQGSGEVPSGARGDDLSSALVTAAIAQAHAKKLAPMQLQPGAELGLAGAATYVVPTIALPTEARAPEGVSSKFKRWLKSMVEEPEQEDPGAGLVVRFEREPDPKTQREFLHDIDLLVGNWRIAESSLRLQDKLARERMEMVKEYGRA